MASSMPIRIGYRTKLLLCYLPFFLIVLCSDAQNKMDLRQAIDSTLKNNLQLRQALVTGKNSTINLKKSQYDQFPTVNGAINGDFNFGRSLDPTTNLYLNNNAFSSVENISMNFTLFQGSQKINQIQQNKYLVESDKSAEQKLRNDLTIQVIANFLSVLDARDQLAAAKQQETLSKQQLSSELNKYNAGKNILADVSRARYQLSKTEIDISNSENQYKNAYIELIQNMNYSSRIILDLSPPQLDTINLVSRSANQIYADIAGKMPDIKTAQFKVSAAIAGINVAKGYYYPRVDLNGVVASSYLYQFHYVPQLFSFGGQPPFFPQLKANKYEYLGLSINIPIFNGYNAKMSVARAKIAVESARLEENIAQNNLYKVINQAVDDLANAEKNYLAARELFKSATETFKTINNRYNRGLSTSLDFNQAQSDLNQAQFNLINTRYQLIFKQKVISFYEGSPLDF